MGVRAVLVEDIEGPGGEIAGAIEWLTAYKEEGVAGMGFRCPCGCGTECYIPVRPKGSARTQTPEWEWDGSREAPTLSPSVFNSGLPCKWHGWLRAGVWEG